MWSHVSSTAFYSHSPPHYINTHFYSLSLSLFSCCHRLSSEQNREEIMDVYGGIDDLLDFSNEDLFSSSSSSTAAATTSSSPADLLPPPETPSFLPFHYPSEFSDSLSLPSDDVAELEWLSRFVDDSFTDFPTNLIAGTINVRSGAAFSGKARTKRSRGGVATLTGMTQESEKPKPKKETNRAASPSSDGGVRRCTHCASEKTPQWRTGPLGPKTLCNACGVRYKSGRLVPEYRPAASPTFVLTQHSNSHRKVMELRRQKEMLKQQQQQQHHHHHQDFRVC